jgi:hypothetical protein
VKTGRKRKTCNSKCRVFKGRCKVDYAAYASAHDVLLCRPGYYHGKVLINNCGAGFLLSTGDHVLLGWASNGLGCAASQARPVTPSGHCKPWPGGWRAWCADSAGFPVWPCAGQVARCTTRNT